jgi:K+-transporting ATPase c subunit
MSQTRTVCNMCVCFWHVQEVKHKEDIHRLLRTISHEIRNPLHGILGNSQALLDTLQEAEQRLAAAAEATRQAALAAVAVADSAAAADAVISPAPCGCTSSLTDRSAVSDSPSNCQQHSSSALSAADNATLNGSDQASNSSTVDCRVTAAEQQRHSASSSDAAAATADSTYVHASPGCSTNNSGNSSSSSSSSTCACSNTALLHELSRKLHTVREMVAEIHECGLHQVSDSPLISTLQSAHTGTLQ